MNGKPVAARVLAPKKKPLITIKRRTVDPLTQIYNRYRSQILTDEQMQAKANEWVTSQVNPNTDIVKQEAERLRGQAAGRRDAMQAAYMAAAGANAQMAPQILAGFQSAANTLGGLSAGATGQVGAAQRADIASQDQALRSVGQAATSTGDPAEQQGVENYVGGYLPAANLAEMGGIAQRGFLGEVADERMRAVSIPWGEYSDTIASLDEKELSELSDLAAKRPDLVQGVMEKLTANNEKLLGGMLDVEKERADRRQQLAKIKQADATLRLRYQEARRDAHTDAEKAAVDRWYKNQQVKLSAARNAVSMTNAQTSQGRLGVSRFNAQTSRMNAIDRASGKSDLKSIAEVIASAGRSRRDVSPAIPKPGQSQKLANSLERNKIRDALFEQYKLSVPRAQWPALKAQLTRWVYRLPLRAGSAASDPFAGLPTAGG